MFKKYRHKESGEEFEVNDKCLNGSDPKIGLWQWRSASAVTGVDFSYSSVERDKFNQQYEPIE